MTQLQGRVAARRVALANAVLIFILLVAVPILAVSTSTPLSLETVPWALSAGIYSLLALLISIRQPGHIIGWLFIVIGFLNGFLFTGLTLFSGYGTVAAGNSPNVIAINPVTSKIYVANFESDNVTVIDGSDNSTGTVTAGERPIAITVNPVTDKIYVANYDSNNVTVIDGSDNSTETVAAGGGPIAIAINPVTDKIYVANFESDNVTVIDGSDNSIGAVTAGERPIAIAVNPVTDKIYVANRYSGDVTVINGSDNNTETVTAGSTPRAIAVNPATNKIYVANSLGNSVTVIDGSDNTTGTPPALVNFLWELSWIIAFLTPITLVLLYFPNGRLPSRRWRPVPILAVLGMLALALGFQPGVLGATAGQFYQDNLSVLPVFLTALSIILSLAAVVVRYARSHDKERLQMKWLVYTAVVAILLMLSGSLVLGGDSIIVSGFSVMVPALIATAIGIAILRYRLFNIDIIIRRTIQYGLLTGLLALVYFGLVVILQSVFAAVGGVQSEIFIVISTLVIAGLFNPLRRRVQEAVDRRFYRGKYDAEKALAHFSAVARDEVDLDKLKVALLEVVEQTIQPERIGITLISDD